MRLTDVIIVESDVTFPYMYLEFPDWSHAEQYTIPDTVVVEPTFVAFL